MFTPPDCQALMIHVLSAAADGGDVLERLADQLGLTPIKRSKNTGGAE
jgi:hypothetical protein